MRKFTLFFSLLLITLTGFAGKVSLHDAQLAGLHFFSEKITRFYPDRIENLAISGSYALPDATDPVYYIFNFNDNGFVAVSADNAAYPILCYSFEGIYTGTNLPPQFVAWMKQYEDQIRFLKDNHIYPSEKITGTWQRFLSSDNFSDKHSVRLPSVAPLTTSTWNQDNYYNEGCPADPAGPGGHVYSGCVPTAMGQIMYYYRWPDHGTGSYTDRDTTYGTLHVNYDSTWYGWNNMTTSITGSNPAIAQLLYHVGVACDLVYGAGGSGMYNHKAAYALKNFFKYSPDVQYVFRDSTNLNWDSLIMAHLNKKMPLYYAGWSVPDTNGHAFVCDGYQDSAFFHFNWGWGGSYDGYFYLDHLNPGGNTFYLAQELVINFFPDTINYSYPLFCTGNTTLQSNTGSFGDGSGPLDNYSSSADCTWLIDPQTSEDSVSGITLKFTRFGTNPADSVKIFDGTSTTSPLLGIFSGDTVPSSLTSMGNKMLITFKSNGVTTAQGWSATYNAIYPVWCNSILTITSDTTEITDGSGDFNYHNRSNCRWMIEPANQNGNPLTIFFKSFDTEPDKDILEIHDLADDNTAHFLAKISGHYDEAAPPDSVTSPSGKMYVIFTTNQYTTGKGWEFYYPRKKPSGIDEIGRIETLNIFPNPASGYINIRMTLAESQHMNVQLLTPEGKSVLEKELVIGSGFTETILNVSGIARGIYFVHLTGNKNVLTQKVVIE